jgi:hypothetical protein
MEEPRVRSWSDVARTLAVGATSLADAVRSARLKAGTEPR